MPEHTPSTEGERFVGKCPYGNTTYCDGPTGELMCGAQGEGCSRDFHHARLTRELEAARQQIAELKAEVERRREQVSQAFDAIENRRDPRRYTKYPCFCGGLVSNSGHAAAAHKRGKAHRAALAAFDAQQSRQE